MSERNIRREKVLSMATFVAYKIIDGKKDIVFKTQGNFAIKDLIKETIKEKLKINNVDFDGIDVILNANGGR